MKIHFGNGQTKFGPGVQINLTGEEVARAIYTYLHAHNIHVFGAATIRVNKKLCKSGRVYVDPSGSVITKVKKWKGDGTKQKRLQ